MINQIKKGRPATSIKQIQKTILWKSKLEDIIKETKTYDEEYHLKNKSDNLQEIYQEFKNAVLNLSNDIDINATNYILDLKNNT